MRRRQGGAELPATVVDPVITVAPDSATTTTTTWTPPKSCEETVEALQGGESPSADVNLVDLADRNQLAPLPVPGAEAAAVTDRQAFASREDYITLVALDDPMQRFNDLGTAGFTRGLQVDMELGPDSYEIIVMELGSPEQAMQYRTAHLRQACARADGMQEMPALPGGAVFYRSDTNAARATIVLGRYELNLEICECVEVVDRLALAEEWAAAIVADLET